MQRSIVASISLVLIVLALVRLEAERAGLRIERVQLGSIPVTLYTRPGAPPAPFIAIAHGFAGSQQFMQTFALTLAQNGYVVATFDFPGHGQNTEPLPGGLADATARNRALAGALGRVIEWGMARAEVDGHLALLGHSMASDVVVRYALEHPEVAATVAVSLFWSGSLAERPRDLLIIDGALEPAALREQALVAVTAGAGPPPTVGATSGSFAAGSARRVAFSPDVEHIGVLYSPTSMHEALAWMDQAFARAGTARIATPGLWLLLLFTGLVAAGWPLARLLPRLDPPPPRPTIGPAPRGLRFAALALVPALLTPFILLKVPSNFLPVLLADYLLMHFAVYGVLTLAGLILVGALPARRSLAPARTTWLAIATCTVLVAAYAIGAIGVAADRYLTNLAPTPERIPIILAMLVGTLPYFIGDEWLTRSREAPRAAYFATKVCFLVGLAIAIALNLGKLFFLVIIVPVILILFTAFGLLSGWVYRQTGHPLPAALANALAFAWAIAVVFPMVVRP